MNILLSMYKWYNEGKWNLTIYVAKIIFFIPNQKGNEDRSGFWTQLDLSQKRSNIIQLKAYSAVIILLRLVGYI